MRVEHFALQVPDPVAMAAWYVKHLGFSVARSGGEPSLARFLRDASGSVLVEVYRNPRAAVPDYPTMNALAFHLAFHSIDPANDRDRLVAAGARVEDDMMTTPTGDQIAMLRDPWGIPVQLVKRAEPMLPP